MEEEQIETSKFKKIKDLEGEGEREAVVDNIIENLEDQIEKSTKIEKFVEENTEELNATEKTEASRDNIIEKAEQEKI